MLLYQVGPDRLEDSEFSHVKDVKWIVYWYENGGYDGNGQAVVLKEDGLLYVGDLGHCSCYGPTESLEGLKGITVKEYLEPTVFDNYTDAVLIKVRELL